MENTCVAEFCGKKNEIGNLKGKPFSYLRPGEKIRTLILHLFCGSSSKLAPTHSARLGLWYKFWQVITHRLTRVGECKYCVHCETLKLLRLQTITTHFPAQRNCNSSQYRFAFDRMSTSKLNYALIQWFCVNTIWSHNNLGDIVTIFCVIFVFNFKKLKHFFLSCWNVSLWFESNCKNDLLYGI